MVLYGIFGISILEIMLKLRSEFKISQLLSAWKQYSTASKEHGYYTVTEVIEYLDKHRQDYNTMFNGHHYEVTYFILLRNGIERNICDICVNHADPNHILEKYYHSSAGAEMSLSIFLSMMIRSQNYCSNCKSNLFILKHKLYDL